MTRYAALTRRQAVVVALLFVVVTVWLFRGATRDVASEVAATAVAPAASGHGDVDLFKSVVVRMRAGEGYYAAMGAELRGRHYPTRPVFAWRQPTYAWLLGRLPALLLGNALLILVGVSVVGLTFRWMRGSDVPGRTLLATALMAVTMSECLLTNFVFMPESWAGCLLALSICFFALDLWPFAVAAGLAALAFRELALLPCAVGLWLALCRRRWREAAVWLVGLVIYAGLMACHFAEVTRHLGPQDSVRGWLAFGGSSFLVATCQWNGLLVLLPRWAIALVLPFILLGLAGWRDVGVTRAALVVFGYLLVFSFAGNPFNDYWGAVFAPLLSYGLVVAPDCVRDLWRALLGVSVSPPALRE